MRKIYYFISAAVIALGLASCNKEDVVSADPSQTGHKITFVANTESCIDTKTTLSGDDANGYQVLWSEGDVLSTKENYKFILTDGAGTTRGTFVADDNIEDGDDIDIFYATTGKTLGNKTIYKGDGSISSAPMMAKLTIEGGVVTSVTDFKNMCGLLRLTLKGSGTVREVRVIDDEPLHGNIDRIKDDGSVVVEPSDYLDEYTLKVDCGDGVDLSDEGTDFYFPMPPGDYTGIKIEIEDVLGKTVTKTMKSERVLNITRALITPVNLSGIVLNNKPDVPDGALYGEFTVNAQGKKVYFSKGNMYWDGDSFELEEHQYDVPRKWDTQHAGHFYWSKDADSAHGDTIYEYRSDDDVLFTNNPKNPERPNEDFIVNDVKGKFRALSNAEWEYLFQNHAHKWVTVHGTNGYVIAPDGVTLTLDKSSYSEYELTAKNLVFIPVTGFRYSLGGLFGIYSQVIDTEYGIYLSSSSDDEDTSRVRVLKIGLDDSDENPRIVMRHPVLFYTNAGCIRPVADVD